jgi:hypothetical protein
MGLIWDWCTIPVRKRGLRMSAQGSLIRLYELGFSNPESKDAPMPNNPDSNIATADALTLLLHNQHALGAAIEEITKWLSENGVERVSDNALVAMETLDANAKAITNAITRLRQS